MKNVKGVLVVAAAMFFAVAVYTVPLYAFAVSSVTAGDDKSLVAGNSPKDDAGQDRDQERAASAEEKQCEGEGADPAHLLARAPGVSLPDRTTLLSAVSIVNNGKEPAAQVEVRSIQLKGGRLTSALPIGLGVIVQNGRAPLDADWSGDFSPRNTYAMVVEGTFVTGEERKRLCKFRLTVDLRVPPAAPGSSSLKTVNIGAKKVEGAHYPPQKPRFDAEVNRSEWTIPRGRFVAGKPTPTSTGLEKVHIGDPPAINFVSNDSLGVGGSSIAEPSGSANGGGIVFTSANWLAAYSTNGGNSFTKLDPTTIFPPDAVGFCCDQVVQYAPSIDRFIWLLQGNGVRIAVASPAQVKNNSGTAWTYWDLTPDVFGFAGSGFDYPDLSVGNNFLYMSWNVSGKGHLVVRTSLAGLQAGGTINLGFTNPADSSMAWFSHLVQNTRDEIFWAGHNNTSSMRVFNLAENSNSYFWRDVTVATWTNGGFTSTTPDNQNWLGEVAAVGTWIAGGTRAGNHVWFAWTAGKDDHFRQPHVNMVALNRANNFAVDQQVQIWNNDYAFGYPALSTNACTGEVGLSLEYGGNGHWENHVVGFWGDFIVYITTASDTGTGRFGDYVTLRQEPPTKADPGNLFNAYGYGITGGKTDIHYVLFGRPASACKTTAPPHPTPKPTPEFDRCVCEDGFKAGPTVKQGSVACEHICRGHERH